MRGIGFQLGMVVGLLAVGAGAAQAQQPQPMKHDTTKVMMREMPNDSMHAGMHGQMHGQMQGQMEGMSMMSHMMAQALNTTLDLMSRPETAKKLAAFSKNYFDALMAQGFTRAEALRLVESARMPMMGQ